MKEEGTKVRLTKSWKLEIPLILLFHAVPSLAHYHNKEGGDLHAVYGALLHQQSKVGLPLVPE